MIGAAVIENVGIQCQMSRICNSRGKILGPVKYGKYSKVPAQQLTGPWRTSQWDSNTACETETTGSYSNLKHSTRLRYNQVQRQQAGSGSDLHYLELGPHGGSEIVYYHYWSVSPAFHTHMRPTSTEITSSKVCVSVSLFVISITCAKIAEPLVTSGFPLQLTVPVDMVCCQITLDTIVIIWPHCSTWVSCAIISMGFR